jgi:hypothetical protein
MTFYVVENLKDGRWQVKQRGNAHRHVGYAPTLAEALLLVPSGASYRINRNVYD